MSFTIETRYYDDIHTLAADILVVKDGLGDRIGGGAYAEVFDHSTLTNTVVKVSGGDDQGYLMYLKVMSELGIVNRYLPKIDSVIYYRLTDEARSKVSFPLNFEYIVTYMEKLSQPEKIRSKYNEQGMYTPDRPDPPVAKFNARIKKVIENREVLALSKYRPVHQDLIILLQIAYEAYQEKSSGASLDLHAGNSMVRGRGFVVTDPLSC